MTKFDQERISLRRRAIFSFGTTIASFLLVAYVLASGTSGILAEKVVSLAFEYMGLMAMLYLGASVIDRTKLVDKISQRWDGPQQAQDEEPRRRRRETDESGDTHYEP